MPDNEQLNRFLAESRTLLSSAQQNGAVLDRLQPLGYDADSIQDLLDALDGVETLYRAQQQEYAEQYRATDVLHERIGRLRQRLQRHRRLARLAFEDDTEGFDVLKLQGSPKGTYEGLMHQASDFYEVLHDRADLRDAMTRFSVTDEVIAAALEDVDGVRRAKTDQLSEMSEAQEATAIRDDAVDDFSGRMLDFREVVRLATQDRPQLREALGMVTPR